MKRRLTIGIDLDGVVDDLVTPWLASINECLKQEYRVEYDDITMYNIVDSIMAKNKFDESKRNQITDIVYDGEGLRNAIRTATPIPNAIHTIKKLLKDDRFDVYFVTSTAPSCCLDKYMWLKRHLNLTDDSRIIFTHRKQLFGGDVLIDDWECNLFGGRYYGLLYTQPWNKSVEVPKGQWRRISRVNNWDEIMKCLEELYEYREVVS